MVQLKTGVAIGFGLLTLMAISSGMNRKQQLQQQAVLAAKVQPDVIEKPSAVVVEPVKESVPLPEEAKPVEAVIAKPEELPATDAKTQVAGVEKGIEVHVHINIDKPGAPNANANAVTADIPQKTAVVEAEAKPVVTDAKAEVKPVEAKAESAPVEAKVEEPAKVEAKEVKPVVEAVEVKPTVLAATQTQQKPATTGSGLFTFLTVGSVLAVVAVMAAKNRKRGYLPESMEDHLDSMGFDAPDHNSYHRL